MDTGEEVDFALPVPEDPSSAFSKPKLKRLKKAASFPSPPLSASFSELPVVPPSTLTLPNTQDPIGSGINSSDAIRDETLGQQKLPEQNLDQLFSFPLLNGSVDALDGLGGEGKFGARKEEATFEDTRKQKSVKRKLSLDGQEEDVHRRKDKRDRSRKSAGHNGKPTASIRKKRALEKERKVELENFHAESQRLLRETRDASFKPVKLVQKPISSVLEKIRQRKLEIMKSIQNSETANPEPTNDQINVDQNYEDDQLLTDIGSKTAYLNRANDAQEDEWDYQLKSKRAKLANEQKTSSSHSQRPASIFKFHADGKTDGIDSFDNDDVLSTEDESDKENIGPGPFYIGKMGLSPKKPLGKAFVDDEAEESDDSDYDLLRSQDDDESDVDGQEELDDLIDTGYLEAPIDQEQRDELHQKWLEQQDVVETDNVLQRLKYGQGRGHLAFLHDYYSDKDEDDSENDSRDNVEMINLILMLMIRLNISIIL
ncbi:hypothetical protein HPP92_018472 [Vanilla planifolia]|uniref:DNA replication checkpoint mediator MRC1 domain-containing protein n=1 Tax=Vanilla planifolia TaxID=51239 RepID=A0A835QCW6_VANPL|nr:hypothetical protein HPP92_018472 [Vanilla planifolia]